MKYNIKRTFNIIKRTFRFTKIKRTFAFPNIKRTFNTSKKVPINMFCYLKAIKIAKNDPKATLTGPGRVWDYKITPLARLFINLPLQGGGFAVFTPPCSIHTPSRVYQHLFFPARGPI